MTPLRVQFSRAQLISGIKMLELDWGDEEDAEQLADLLLQSYGSVEAWSWMMWPCAALPGARSPLAALRDGMSRDVFVAARQLPKKDGP
jgi:hypothetical protein